MKNVGRAMHGPWHDMNGAGYGRRLSTAIHVSVGVCVGMCVCVSTSHAFSD